MPLVVETVLPTAEKKSLVGESDLLTTARESNVFVLSLTFFFFFLLERTASLKGKARSSTCGSKTAALRLAPLTQRGWTVPSEPIAHAEDQVVDAVRCGGVTFSRTKGCDKCACSCRLDSGGRGGVISYESTLFHTDVGTCVSLRVKRTAGGARLSVLVWFVWLSFTAVYQFGEKRDFAQRSSSNTSSDPHIRSSIFFCFVFF